MGFKVGIVLLTALNAIIAGKDKLRWGYEQTVFGPRDWEKAAPQCNGRSQSPIDIITSSAQTNSSYSSLVLTFDNTDGAVFGSLTNNGHAPTVVVDKIKGGVTLKGAPLGQTLYVLEQFHFHFGCDSSVGSEHTVDGNSYASEMHLVFYNTFYGSFQEAASKPDGLAVIGVFLQVDGVFSKWMENIAASLRNVKFPDEVSYRLRDSIPLAKLVPDLVSKNAPFFTYKGSLTTPPCYESVRWIVMRNPISVTESQLEMMRSLVSTSGNPLCNNFRPVNPLNGRKLFKGPGQGKLPGLLSVPLYH